MAFVDSVPKAEESVAAVMRRYPDQALPMMQYSEAILRGGECALFNMMNRIMDGYGVKNTAELRLERGRLLAERGYIPVIPPQG